MWPPQNAAMTEAVHHMKTCDSPSTLPPEHLLPSPVTPSSDRSFPHLDVLHHNNRHITPLDTVNAVDATELSRVDPALLHASTMHSPPLSVESVSENGPPNNLLPLTVPMDTRGVAANHNRQLSPMDMPSGLAALPRKPTDRSELTTSMKGSCAIIILHVLKSST